MRDFRDAKTMAQTLREFLATKAVTITHSESLELVSKMLGVADWNTLSALLQSDHPAARPSVKPVGRERAEAGRYPAVPIRDMVPFPTAVFPLFIGREKTKASLDHAFRSRRDVVLAIQKDAGVDEPGLQDILEIGLLAQLVGHEQMEDGSLKVLLEAYRRVVELLTTLDPLARLRRLDIFLNSSAIPLSPAFKATQRRAMDSATQRNHRYATLEHLLLALIEDADASAVLQACNADLAGLKADLLGLLGSKRENLRAEPGSEARPTTAFRRVAQRAQLHAQELSRATVTGADFLMGLFSETHSPAVRLLDKQGVSSGRASDVVALGGGPG